MMPLSVLLIGREEWLIWPLPAILSRAGFNVDVLTGASIMKSCRFVRQCEVIPANQSIIARAAQKCEEPYDWIVIAEDQLLAEVRHSHLSVATKLKLLPVLNEENFSHIHSKIGLSYIFSNKGIITPSFCIAANREESYEAARQIGYPVFLKVDASGGGGGVYVCCSPEDFRVIDESVWLQPVLIQKKIEGVVLDLSALYLEGELIHFSYSKMEKVVLNQFGPSSLRTYFPLSSVDQAVFDELRDIGKALGAHGFTNVTAIEAANGSGRYYIEADMRPNVWVDAARFIGDDPATKMACWFAEGKALENPLAVLNNPSSGRRIPCFLRLHFFELLFNRYQVWQFIPKGNPKLIVRLLLKSALKSLFQEFPKKLVKCCVPRKYHKRLKRMSTSFFRISR